jgi:hypothetical protein
MELSLGILTAQFITDPTAWKVWGPIGLVAECHPQDWCNDAVDFRSKEAGQMLLENLHEIYADFQAPVEAEMVKNDQGIVKDVPDTSPENISSPKSILEDNSGEVTAEEILSFIKELLDACESNPEPDLQMVEAIENLVSMHKQAVERELETLISKAEVDSKNGLDVTATLNRIESLIQE